MQLRVWHLILLAAALGVALLMPLEAPNRELEAWLDMAHAPAFGLLALAAMLYFRTCLSVPRGWLALAIWLAATIVGALMELVQASVGRGTSMQDAVANSMGAGAVLALYCGVGAPRTPRRLPAFALAVLMLVVAWARPGATLIDSFQQKSAFPELTDFESWTELGRWQLHRTRLDRSRQHVSRGTWSGKFTFGPKWASAALLMPSLDWRPYEALELDLFLVSQEAETLGLRVCDATHNGQEADRYQECHRLKPGRNRLRVRMSDIAAGPEHRLLQLEQITWLQLIVKRERGERVIFVDNIRLLRDERH